MGVFLIGYSGHAFVVSESALNSGVKLLGYYEASEKNVNPYSLAFMGPDDNMQEKQPNADSFFISIGDNLIRKKIFDKWKLPYCNITDPSAHISNTAMFGIGVYIGKNACINALSTIGNGAIINTATIIEHECNIGAFSHIAPGSVLCGNVKIGQKSFIGANSVIRPGITIGDNVIIGAGSVVIKDIPNNAIAYGNPIKIKK